MEVLFCGIPNGRTQKVQHQAAHRPVSYTHLTLPTKA